MEVFIWLANAILRLALQIQYYIGEQFYAELTETVLDILSYPTHIRIKVLRRLERAILRLVFADTVNASFNYTFFSTDVQAQRSLQLCINYLKLTMK